MPGIFNFEDLFEWEKNRKHLPIGSGPHTVGCIDYMNDHTINGTLMRIYYPTKATDTMKCQMQWPLWLPRKQYGKGYMYFRRKNTKVFGRLFNWMGGDVYVPALWQAPVLQTGHKFPVIVFSHGLGGNRTTYSTLCVDLASHGFIVAALEHRDGSASMTFCLRHHSHHSSDRSNKHHRLHRDHSLTEEWVKYERQENEVDFHVRNKQVHKRAAECVQVLNLLEAMHYGEDVHNILGLHFDISQFKGVIDLDRVSIVGHSFGGSTAIATAAKDKRYKVAVSLDGWMIPLDQSIYSTVTQPILFVNTETFQWKENVKDMFILESTNHAERIVITVRGTCHQSQSDFQFIANRVLGRFLELRYTLEPTVALEMNSKATMGFLWKHLGVKNKPHYEDILKAEHELIIPGTNVDLN